MIYLLVATTFALKKSFRSDQVNLNLKESPAKKNPEGFVKRGGVLQNFMCRHATEELCTANGSGKNGCLWDKGREAQVCGMKYEFNYKGDKCGIRFTEFFHGTDSAGRGKLEVIECEESNYVAVYKCGDPNKACRPDRVTSVIKCDFPANTDGFVTKKMDERTKTLVVDEDKRDLAEAIENCRTRQEEAAAAAAKKKAEEEAAAAAAKKKAELEHSKTDDKE